MTRAGTDRRAGSVDSWPNLGAHCGNGNMRGSARAAPVQTKAGSKRDRVRALCEALPHAEHTATREHDTYRVRGKVFAYFLDNHHGDGIVSVCVKSERGENVDRARLFPERFYLPDYIGPRGWF